MAMKVVDEAEKDLFLANIKKASLLKKGKDEALDKLYDEFE